ncbi:MAG: mechanosensitive ion channel domain-containing protein, partial [Candidatus Eisenbacteria bacterium]
MIRISSSTFGPRRALLPGLVTILVLAAISLAGAQPTPIEPSAPDSAPAATLVPVQPDSISSDSLAAGLIRPDTVAVAASATPAPAESAIVIPLTPATIQLGGKEIFRIRASRDGLAPAARVTAIHTRLNQAIADLSVPADSVLLIPDPSGIQVRLGPYLLWVITPGDAPSQDPAVLATALARLPRAIEDGIARERASRRPGRLLISAGIALALALAAFGLAQLLFRARRRWRLFLTQTIGRKLPPIRLRTFELLSKQQVGSLVIGTIARIDVLVGVVLFYFYLTLVFSLFPWTQGWSSGLLKFAVDEALLIVRSLLSALPGLFAVGLIFLIFHWITRMSAQFFNAIEDGRIVMGSFHPELAKPSKRIVTILLWVAAVIMAYPYIPGSGSKAVQGVSLLFGVVVSLGSTGFIGNMISGIVLTYSRSFKIGERVRIGEHVGDVVNLGFFATKLRTIRNEEVTIPNGQVAATSILNYTRLADGPGLILYSQVTIGYDVDWRQVHALLIEAALRVEGVEKDPKPWVYQRSLDDSYPTYEINCITHESHPQLRMYSDL